MANRISEKVTDLGMKLPQASTPVGNYVARLRVDNMLHISGQLPIISGTPLEYVGCVYAVEDRRHHDRRTNENAVEARSDLRKNPDRRGTLNGCKAIAAFEAAQICGLNILAHIAAEVDDDLDKVAQIIRLGGFVASASDFAHQPQVINGASNLMVDVFGEKVGKHVRAAVGTSSLPANVPVEIEATVLLKG